MKSFEPSGSDSLASAMTKALSNERANHGVGRAAVERHVKAQVLELHGVAALLREFAQAHDKYAQDYAIKLPLTAPPDMDLKSCPQLHRVTQQLERFLACTAQAHATLASELRTSVVAPLEAFEKQQRHQTKQLLSEIDDALQRETRVHASLQRLLSKEEPASLVIDDNQDTEVLADLVRADAKATQDTRDRERDNVRQRLAELDLTDEQQTAILHGQLRRCFDAIARHARRVLGDAADSLASLALLTASQQRREARGYFGSDHDAALAYSTLHVDVTSWMIAVFSQLLPIEEAMVKRLQTLVKSHPLATVKAVFGDSLPTDESTETTTLWDLLVSHKQLTANLADPIARTLRVSKQKQETIRNEVSESMSELERLAQAARNKVTDKEAKLLQFLQQEQQQQDDMTRPVLGSTGTETVVSSFNLRSAVAALTRQLSSSPKKPLLFKSKSVSSVGVLVIPVTPPSSLSPTGVTVTKSPRRVTLESDLIEARVQVETLANKRVVQKDEMVQTLEASAFVGVKTLEAMVSDYLKNVTKAMALAATATAKCTERLSANEETPTKASRRFQTIRLFDIGDPSDAEVAKRLGDELGPETALTSETEMSETGTESGKATGPPVKPLEVVRRSSVTFVLPTEEEMKKRLSVVATEVVQICSELPIRETIEQIWSLTKTLLGVTWKALGPFLHSVHRSPDQWQCVVAVLVLLGLLCVVRRFDRLDRGWHELTELHRENARGLQQLVDLIGG